MNDDSVPNSYAQWRHYIEVRCGIRLTPSYISKRLSELQDDNHVRTREFARFYGAEQLQSTITWFRRASDEVPGESGGHRHA